MRLVIDMNLSPRWAGFLADAGFDATHWMLVGPNDAPDTAIMSHAREHDMVVLTNDLDFGAILAATRGEKPSVLQVRAEDLSPEAIGARVVAALRQLTAELEAGALVTLDAQRVRLRILPLSQRG